MKPKYSKPTVRLVPRAAIVAEVKRMVRAAEIQAERDAKVCLAHVRFWARIHERRN